MVQSEKISVHKTQVPISQGLQVDFTNTENSRLCSDGPRYLNWSWNLGQGHFGFKTEYHREETIKLHKYLVMIAYILFLNGIPYLIPLIRKIIFTAVNHNFICIFCYIFYPINHVYSFDFFHEYLHCMWFIYVQYLQHQCIVVLLYCHLNCHQLALLCGLCHI